MTALVTYQLKDGIATLVMDDGKVNVVSLPLLTELNAALDRAVADKAAVVLAGRTGAFSAGFDMKVLGAGGAGALELLVTGFEASERLLSFPHPVVIACTGHAIAMGSFLVLSGDYRIGADGAFKIGANEVAIGLTMPHYAVEICRQRLAPAHFHRAVINAEFYAPADAVAAGFLDRVVPEAGVLAEAQAVAARLAKLPRAVHSATKLRARAPALKAIRAGIEADEREFNALSGKAI
jgi:enoyl-CoA hydratase